MATEPVEANAMNTAPRGPSPVHLPTRREMLQRSVLGFGSIALAGLLQEEGLLTAGESGASPVLRPPSGKARSVIFLFMGGGPSQVDTFDPKPLVQDLNGQDVPNSIAQGVPRIARAPLNNLLASPWSFQQYGESGIPVSDLFPNVGECIDDLCVIRSMRHDSPIHAPAEFIATTGSQVGDRPSLGAWLTYGLGSENRDLPSFLVFTAHSETLRAPTIGAGFLPARFQGVHVDAERGIPNLAMPVGHTPATRQAQLSLIGALNQKHLDRHAGDSELEARIRAYELSFRMQSAAPEAFDLGGETKETQRLYGIDQEETAEYGRQCLLARRLVERGVRFIQLRSGGWDAHGNIAEEHARSCRATDRPIAGLLSDLKRRGLLDETLVVWGGEFGRTPTAQGGAKPGRDHSPSGYTMWLAGGGVKGGQVIGVTDPVGYAAIDRPIHPNDLHATVLHALGVDQHELFYLHHNRKEIVTVNGGKIISEVFA
jgi:hypothetical protein